MRKTHLGTAALFVSLMLIGAGCSASNDSQVDIPQQPERAEQRAPEPAEQAPVVAPPAAAAPTPAAPAPSAAAPAPKTAPAGYTLAEVAKHKVDGNCWTAINGSVYDLSDWVAKHPGGDRSILRICGMDGSAAFNGQHGGESRPEKILAGYLLGPLAAK